MRKFLAGLSNLLAVILSIVFVAAAFVAILLVVIEQRILDPQLYKAALEEQRAYERLPRIFAEQITTTMSFNPCQDNPLHCEDVAAEFHPCVQEILGEARYIVLLEEQEPFSESDRMVIQPCIEQYGQALMETTLKAAPSGVRECVQQNISEDAYRNIHDRNREPTADELTFITPCFDAASLVFVTEEAGPPPYMKNLSSRDWETIITNIIPPDELQVMAEQALDQVFAYLNGEIEQVVLPLSGIKDRMAGPKGMDALVQIIRAQPGCTSDEILQIEAAILAENGDMVFCNPPDDLLNRMTRLLEQQLLNAAEEIPEQAVVLKANVVQSNDPENQNTARNFRMVRMIMRASPDLPLGIMLLITFLVVRTPKSWLRWWGIPSMLAGIFSIGMVTVATETFNQWMMAFIANRIPSYISTGLVSFGRDFSSFIMHSLLESVALAGVMLGIVGLGMVVGSFVLKKHNYEVTNISGQNEINQ